LGLENISPYKFSHTDSLTEVLRVSQAERIFILGNDTLPADQKYLENYRKAAQTLQLESRVEYLINLDKSTLVNRISQLPPKSAIIFTPSTGENFKDKQVPRILVGELAREASAPIFVGYSPLVGTGAVGGLVYSSFEAGKQLAKLALGIETGKKLASFSYDGEALARWNIGPDRLLPEAQLVVPFPPESNITKVVILGDLDTSKNRTQAIIDGFVAEHKAKNSSVDYVVINSAPANLERNPDSASLISQLNSIVGFDGVVASWGDGVGFIERNFPNKWLIKLSPSTGESRPQSVQIGRDFAERTLRTAQLAQTLPNRNGDAFVVLGDLSDDAATTALIETELKLAGFTRVRFINERNLSLLEQQVGELKASDTLFFLPLSYDDKNELVSALNVSQRLGDSSAAPMFTMWQSFIGRGAVGGHAFQPELAGRAAFSAIDDINVSGRAQGPYFTASTLIDHQAFEAFGGTVESLPSGAILINPPQVLDALVWIRDNRTPLAVALLIILSLILVYVRERTLRAKVQQSVSKSDSLVNELRTSSERQRELFAVVGHELRTPVASIEMVIKDEDLSAQEKVSTVEGINANLLSVLEDMRTVVAPERAKESREVYANPIEVLRRAASPLTPLLGEKGVKFELQLPGDTQTRYFFSDQALRQLVTNLVKNAAIHSEGSMVRASFVLETVSDGAEHTQATLRVEDDGRGIPEGMVSTMFEAFRRGDSKANGSGLGLFIAKGLAEELGGTIEYEPSALGGACFKVCFSLISEHTAQQAQAQAQAQAQSISLDGLRVLLAEDETMLRMLSEKMLTKQGAVVSSVENGKLALDAFDPAELDLVLTDLMMPEMDGHALTAAIRETGATTPIIAVTAAVVGDETDQVLQAGADAFITKPITAEKLVEALTALNKEVEIG
jgi:signal transduction histidine kinase/CheY-like chemotaxis protein